MKKCNVTTCEHYEPESVSGCFFYNLKSITECEAYNVYNQYYSDGEFDLDNCDNPEIQTGEEE